MSKNEQLTDRYVYAVSRDTPEAIRADVASELRSTIADTIEDHIANGADPAQAERDVLLSLGSPTAFAVRYSDRPAFLIGPSYYLVWKRILVTILMWAVPTVATIAALVAGLSDESASDIIKAFVGNGLMAAMHIAFWTTLTFAIVERFAAHTPGEEWTLDELPLLPTETAQSRSDAISGAAFSLVMAAFLALQSQFAWIRSSEPVPILSIDLWSLWLPVLIAVCLGSAALEIWKYRSGWSVGTTVSAILLSLAFTIPVVYLARTEQLLSDVFIDKVGMGPEGVTLTMNFIIVGAVAVSVWEIGEAIYGQRKQRHAVPSDPQSGPSGRNVCMRFLFFVVFPA